MTTTPDPAAAAAAEAAAPAPAPDASVPPAAPTESKDTATIDNTTNVDNTGNNDNNNINDGDVEMVDSSSSPQVSSTVLMAAAEENDDDDSDDEDSSDPFAAFNNKSKNKTSSSSTSSAAAATTAGASTMTTTKKNKKKMLKINIQSSSLSSSSSLPEEREEKLHPSPSYATVSLFSSSGGILDKIDSEKTTGMEDIIVELDFDESVEEQELEDSLKFFEEPHEEQDPEYQKFERGQKRSKILSDLQKLDGEERSGRDEIERFVNDQLKERQAGTERSVERYRQSKVIDEQKKELEKLNQVFKEKMAHSQRKIHEGMQVLRKRQNEENQRYAHQHRQKIQQQNLPDQVANAQWAEIASKLRAKHEGHMAEFARKGDELKSKTNADYKREAMKIKKKYESREKDVEHNRQTINSRLLAGFNQMRSRYLKRYSHGIGKRRDVLKRELALLADDADGTATTAGEKEASHPLKVDDNNNQRKDGSKNEKVVKPALRPPSPLKSCGPYFEDSNHQLSGAAVRHKHRKGVLSQIPKQLSVEIHNEGVWISKLSAAEKNGSSNSDDKKKDSNESDQRHFIPWGFKARELLHSIVCGEIPLFFDSDDKFQLSDTVASNGGHIRCVMTDLRTSDETASAQRAVSVFEQQAAATRKLEEEHRVLTGNIEAAQKDAETLNRQRGELESKMTSNSNDLEKVRSQLLGIRQKYTKYFNPDGSIISGPQGEKFKASYAKYENAVDAYQKRSVQIQAKIGEAKAALQKKNASIKQAQRNAAALANTVKKRTHTLQQVKSGNLQLHQIEGMDSFSARVKWHTTALDATAGKRRAELLHKRNSNSSKTWDQTIPGLSSMLKRSLYFKMHRRRQQIVLRPSFASTMTDLRQIVEKKHAERSAKGVVPDEVVDADVQAAEQRYLLASHPLARRGEKVSSVPDANGWSEPGCHLVLDVPADVEEDRILPVTPIPPLVQTNLSEIYSAPGRQASSMLKISHLRSLEAPLSAIGVATSLSETNPSIGLSPTVNKSPNDPFESSKEMVKLGYTFNNKVLVIPSPSKPSTAQRKRSTASKTNTVPSPAKNKATKKRPSATKHSEKGPSKNNNDGSNSPAAPKPSEKKRKSASHAEGSAPKAAPKRRKSDGSKVNKPTTHQQQLQLKQQQHAQLKQQQQHKLQKQQQLQRQQQQQQQQQQQPSSQQAPMPSINDPSLNPRAIMPQHPQASTGGHYNRGGQPMQTQQSQSTPYGHFMKAMPSPVTTQNTGHRTSFQFPGTPQMQQQFRMMQQQQQQQQRQQQQQQQQQPQMNYVQTPQMQQMQQFFPQMTAQQHFAQQSLLPGLAPMQQQQQMHPQQQQQQHQHQNPNQPRQHHQQQQGNPSSEESNDPLFMLNDM